MVAQVLSDESNVKITRAEIKKENNKLCDNKIETIDKAAVITEISQRNNCCEHEYILS